jgi:hypothetical protein
MNAKVWQCRFGPGYRESFETLIRVRTGQRKIFLGREVVGGQLRTEFGTDRFAETETVSGF